MGVTNEWKIVDDPSASTEQVLGKRVKALRRIKGWTQAELAEVLTEEGFSFSQGTVAKLEGAKRPTTISELVALARIFNQEPKDLLINYEIPDGLFDYAEADREDRAATQNLRDAVWRFISAKQRLADTGDCIKGADVIHEESLARSIVQTPEDIVRAVRESKAEILDRISNGGLDDGLSANSVDLLHRFIESPSESRSLSKLVDEVYGKHPEAT